ncbi:MAG: hypothetical protein IJF08_10450 [Clostridia bacterium]|nr:hypothetical protein [Clostridia bacterium]
MAKAVLGNKGLESAVRAKPVGEAVLLLARSYDKLVRDLEYTLLQISKENVRSVKNGSIEEDA